MIDDKNATGQFIKNDKLDDLVYRLKTRAAIRRQISTRKSVQEGKPDRIADLLEEAATVIVQRDAYIRALQQDNIELRRELYEGKK